MRSLYRAVAAGSGGAALLVMLKVLRLVVAIELCIMLVITSFALSDILTPRLVEPRVSGDAVVFDAEGLVGPGAVNASVARGFTLLDILSLPKLNASLIVIVSHGFSYDGNGFALGTSEQPSIIYPFIHPVYTASGAVMRGVTSGGEERIVVTPGILDYMHGRIRGVVVIVSCSRGDPGVFARKLLEKGASLVAYYSGDMMPDNVTAVVRGVVRAWRSGDLVEWLINHGFIVVARSGDEHG